MTTRIASPSDRFIGYSTRPADQLHFQLQPQHQYQYQHHHLGGGGGGVFLREGPHSGFLPAPTVQSTALPPNVDTQTASHQRQASTTMASGSSPPYMPTTPPHPRRTSRTGTGTGTGTGRGGRGTAWQPQQLNSNANSTASNYAYWGNNHEALIAQQLSQAPAANDVNDGNDVNETNETYLSALADNDFSSPSSYPSFTNPPPAPRPSTVQHQRRAQAQASAPGPDSAPYARSTAPHNNNDAAVAFAGACNLTRNFSAPERSETQLTTDTNTTTTTALESQNTLFTNDTQEWAELFDTPISSFDENMPVTRSSRRLEVATPPLDSVHPSKRRRTSTNARTPTLRKSASSRNRPTEIKDFDDDDLFVDTKNRRTAPGQEPDAEDLTTIDLTEVNEVPEELSKPEKDNRTKIAAFQCVICMDDAAGLTVTHCGHMYCAQCLHSSLHVETTKGRCPMCRQKLDMKPRNLYNTKTKGYWPLELKLMTATKKGKRKANSTL